MTESVCTEFLNDDSIDFTGKAMVESSKIKLLTHYRIRSASHQTEREEWIAQLESVDHSQEYLRGLMQKLSDSNLEIYKLQARLSTVQDSIFSEKHQTLKLLQENKALKLQELTDKKRLQEFVSLAAPKQSSTFFQDKRPMSAKGTQKGAGECSWCAVCKEYSGPKHNHYVGKTTSVPKTIVRTVYLPNEELNSLVLEVDMIKDQIEQEKETFQSELDALKEEQLVREQEKQLRLFADLARIKELTELAQVEEEGKTAETKFYLRLRYEMQESEKEIRRIIAEMERALEVVSKKYVDSKNLIKVETKEEERQADKKTDEFSYKFRKQVIRTEENTQAVKEQYADLQQKFSEKIEKLEQDIGNLTQSYRDMEEKRRISRNKLNREVDKLQDKLRELEMAEREKNKLKVPKTKKSVS